MASGGTQRTAAGTPELVLEDISAPRCFDIEDKLKTDLDISVFHDDQHGTAIVVLPAAPVGVNGPPQGLGYPPLAQPPPRPSPGGS